MTLLIWTTPPHPSEYCRALLTALPGRGARCGAPAHGPMIAISLQQACCFAYKCACCTNGLRHIHRPPYAGPSASVALGYSSLLSRLYACMALLCCGEHVVAIKVQIAKIVNAIFFASSAYHVQTLAPCRLFHVFFCIVCTQCVARCRGGWRRGRTAGAAARRQAQAEPERR